MGRNGTPTVRSVHAATPGADWKPRRVIIFTEYGDTFRYLREQLTAAFEGTERGDERILSLTGGLGDEGRAAIQRAFNGNLDEHPVRVLLATDAAREGINLQGHCSDLFHYDVPWNPSRLEQRNGRIDRALQPEKKVRCGYFLYTQRAEDAVLGDARLDHLPLRLGRHEPSQSRPRPRACSRWCSTRRLIHPGRHPQIPTRRLPLS